MKTLFKSIIPIKLVFMKKLFTLLAVAFGSLALASATTTEPQTYLVFPGGEGSKIDCGYIPAFTDVDAFTVEAWVFYDAFTYTDGGYIISTEEKVDNVRKGWVLKSEGGTFRLKVGNNGAWPGAQSQTVIETGKWYHVAATYSSSEIKLYINGVLENTAAVSPAMTYSLASLVIGTGTNSYPTRFLEGKLADVRFWNVVRTDEEIANHMTPGSLAGTEAGLVANWKMNEGTGDVVADATGNNNLSINPEILTWVKLQSGIQSTGQSKELNAFVNGKSLQVINSGETAMTVSVYNVAGLKVVSFVVKAGETSVKDMTSLNGVYFLKGISENGDQLNKKVLFN